MSGMKKNHVWQNYTKDVGFVEGKADLLGVSLVLDFKTARKLARNLNEGVKLAEKNKTDRLET